MLDQVRAAYAEKWPALVEVSLVDDWDHLLNVGVRGDVGVLFWSGKELPRGWYSKGEDTGRSEELTYYCMGNSREFPADAEVPLAVVKSAVREFLERTVRNRPTGSRSRRRAGRITTVDITMPTMRPRGAAPLP